MAIRVAAEVDVKAAVMVLVTETVKAAVMVLVMATVTTVAAVAIVPLRAVAPVTRTIAHPVMQNAVQKAKPVKLASSGNPANRVNPVRAAMAVTVVATAATQSRVMWPLALTGTTPPHSSRSRKWKARMVKMRAWMPQLASHSHVANAVHAAIAAIVVNAAPATASAAHAL